MMKTPEQIKGTKLEIFIEKRLNEKGFHNVLRNVEYHKSRYFFRQIDVSYDYIAGNSPELRIVEAKYSSNGKISYRLRSPRERRTEKGIIVIDNLIDEVLDKKRFTGAELVCLATNHSFEDKVKQEAERYGIAVIEYKGRFDRQINKINIEGKTHKNIIYLS